MIKTMYEKYHIMPALQLHQLRVAGVAAYISVNFIDKQSIDTNEIILACLLHDMGNILKFSLDRFPEFLEPQGRDYWQKVQDEYRMKYGNDEHEATKQIVREIMTGLSSYKVHKVIKPVTSKRFTADNDSRDLGLQVFKKAGIQDLFVHPERVMELIDAIGFSKAKQNAESEDYSKKIAAYADMRVTPFGVTSLEERLKDGHERFKTRKPDLVSDNHFEEMTGYFAKIERQIFAHLPEEARIITDETITRYVSEFEFLPIVRR